MLSPEIVEAMLLGAVQGVAEFLPISSSGHLVILQEPLSRWLGTDANPEEKLHLNVAVHLGTLFSILVVYRKDLPSLLAKPRLSLAIVVATLPVVVVGLTLADQIQRAFDKPLLAGCCLLVTALLLIVGQRGERGDAVLDELSCRKALAVGLFQAAAILPGVSRSGSTIAGGLLVGLGRRPAADFSFFIAIPAIAGAAVKTGIDIWRGDGEPTAWPALAVGTATAFVVGCAALGWLLRLISQKRLHWFAIYCASVGALTIAWQAGIFG